MTLMIATLEHTTDIGQEAVGRPSSLRVLISGGGTGGHLFPALAIAEAIRAKVPGAVFQFVGARGKIEMERVPKAGYPIEGLWISGFQRHGGMKQNLLFPFKLAHSLWRARGIVRRFRPDVAIGVGGYASGPTLEMASRHGVPCLVQEQNSLPGITNKLLGRRVDRICVAYPGMERFFPKEKIVLTGNPVRRDLTEDLLSKGEAKLNLGFAPDKPLLLVMGGSGGAKSMNEAMASAYELLASRPEVQVLWQMGKHYVHDFGTCKTAMLSQVKGVAFVEDMKSAYIAADLVACRAGALTLSELALLGKAAILVPSPYVAEDHQTKNARALEERGAAVLLRDAEAKASLGALALELLADERRRQSLGQRIKELAMPNAAAAIAEEALKLVNA